MFDYSFVPCLEMVFYDRNRILSHHLFPPFWDRSLEHLKILLRYQRWSISCLGHFSKNKSKKIFWIYETCFKKYTSIFYALWKLDKYLCRGWIIIIRISWWRARTSTNLTRSFPRNIVLIIVIVIVFIIFFHQENALFGFFCTIFIDPGFRKQDYYYSNVIKIRFNNSTISICINWKIGWHKLSRTLFVLFENKHFEFLNCLIGCFSDLMHLQKQFYLL